MLIDRFLPSYDTAMVFTVAARRKSRRYWRIIAPGVALVMRRALRRIKVAAERPAVNV
jgi:hypothetical protein